MKTFDIPFQIQGRITLTIYEKPVDVEFLLEHGPISAPGMFAFIYTPAGGPDVRITDAGDTRITDAGETRILA